MNSSASQFRRSSTAGSQNGLPPKRQINDRPTVELSQKPKPEELAFAEQALREINRLIDESTEMTRQMDALEPRFREAAMQKAWIVLMSFIIGPLVLMISVAWSGLAIILVRVAIVCALVAVYFAPVHYFVRGELRADARLMRRLDRKSLDRAKKAAKLGQSMSKRMREKVGRRKDSEC